MADNIMYFFPLEDESRDTLKDLALCGFSPCRLRMLCTSAPTRLVLSANVDSVQREMSGGRGDIASSIWAFVLSTGIGVLPGGHLAS